MNIFEQLINNANKYTEKKKPSQEVKTKINRDVLKKVISHLKKQDELSDEIRKASKGCIVVSDLYEDMYFATETLLKELYGEEVDELISWWMYENVEKIITQYVTIKGKKQEVTHDVKSLDSLIDYIIKEYSL